MKNVFLTPHIAGSPGEVHRMGEYMPDEYMRCAGQTPARYEVAAEMLKTTA